MLKIPSTAKERQVNPAVCLGVLRFSHHIQPSSAVRLRHPTIKIHCAVVESYSYRILVVMAAPEVHLLFHHPIADHSFSADKNILAVARDSNVELYKKSGNKFTLQDELKGHDKTVTSVDIAPRTGRIVTCSQGT